MKWDHKRTTDVTFTVSEWGTWTSEWGLETEKQNTKTEKQQQQNKQTTFPTLQTLGYFFPN